MLTLLSAVIPHLPSPWSGLVLQTLYVVFSRLRNPRLFFSLKYYKYILCCSLNNEAIPPYLWLPSLFSHSFTTLLHQFWGNKRMKFRDLYLYNERKKKKDQKKKKNNNPNLDDLRPKVKLQKYNEELKQEAQMKAPVHCRQERQPQRLRRPLAGSSAHSTICSSLFWLSKSLPGCSHLSRGFPVHFST